MGSPPCKKKGRKEGERKGDVRAYRKRDASRKGGEKEKGKTTRPAWCFPPTFASAKAGLNRRSMTRGGVGGEEEEKKKDRRPACKLAPRERKKNKTRHGSIVEALLCPACPFWQKHTRLGGGGGEGGRGRKKKEKVRIKPNAEGFRGQEGRRGASRQGGDPLLLFLPSALPARKS